MPLTISRQKTNIVGIYELEQIHQLVNATPLIHVSLNVPNSPFPLALPMIGQMGSFERPSADIGDPLDLYVHGYVTGRMFNTGRNAPDPGLPVCVSASHVDGLVLAMSAFHSSYNYRSAVLFGHATLVQDPDEKLYALELITNSIVPGRWPNSRLPPTNAELQSTSVLKIKIASGSMKYRDGSTEDEKADMQDESVMNSVWSGVIPMYQAYREPVPSAYNRADVPDYIKDFVTETDKDNKEYCVNAINNPR